MLLYIGAAGPIAGFIVSLAASIIGIYLSDIKPIPVLEEGALIVFGDSLLFKALSLLIHGQMSAGFDIFLSPYGFAGWIGFLITSLNLMPLGQLDGGHILHALIGRRQLYAGWIMFFALVVLSIFWPGWGVWIFMALAVVMIGHSHVDDPSIALSKGEKIMGWCSIAILLLTFIPIPVEIL